jgi:hypothetical protein
MKSRNKLTPKPSQRLINKVVAWSIVAHARPQLEGEVMTQCCTPGARGPRVRGYPQDGVRLLPTAKPPNS